MITPIDVWAAYAYGYFKANAGEGAGAPSCKPRAPVCDQMAAGLIAINHLPSDAKRWGILTWRGDYCGRSEEIKSCLSDIYKSAFGSTATTSHIVPVHVAVMNAMEYWRDGRSWQSKADTARSIGVDPKSMYPSRPMGGSVRRAEIECERLTMAASQPIVDAIKLSFNVDLEDL